MFGSPMKKISVIISEQSLKVVQSSSSGAVGIIPFGAGGKNAGSCAQVRL